MNLVETLLKVDAGKIELPKKELTLALNKLGGIEATFMCQAIDSEIYDEIQKMSTDIKKGGRIDVDTTLMNQQIILAGVSELKDKSLRDHFKVQTPDQLINKIFLPGDISKLADTIVKLSGFNEEDLEANKKKIKNS
jgi:hypothetical protein